MNLQQTIIITTIKSYKYDSKFNSTITNNNNKKKIVQSSELLYEIANPHRKKKRKNQIKFNTYMHTHTHTQTDMVGVTIASAAIEDGGGVKERDPCLDVTYAIELRVRQSRFHGGHIHFCFPPKGKINPLAKERKKDRYTSLPSYVYAVPTIPSATRETAIENSRRILKAS